MREKRIITAPINERRIGQSTWLAQHATIFSSEARHDAIPTARRKIVTASVAAENDLPNKTIEDLKDELITNTNLINRWKDVLARPRLLREILIEAAKEITENLELPDGLAISPAMLEKGELSKTNFRFLGGHSLEGLYKIVPVENPEEERMTGLLRRIGFEPTVDDFIVAKKTKRQVRCERYYGKPLNDIFHFLAENQEPKKPLSIVSYKDFAKPQDVMDGNSFKAFYNHAKLKCEPEKDPLSYLRKKAGIEVEKDDIIQGMQLGFDIPWYHFRKEPALMEFFQEVAHQPKINRPLFLWTMGSLTTPLPFIGNRNLSGLARTISRNKGEKYGIEFLQEFIGDSVSVADIAWAMQLPSQFWGKVPQETKDALKTSEGKQQIVNEIVDEVVDEIFEIGQDRPRIKPNQRGILAELPLLQQHIFMSTHISGQKPHELVTDVNRFKTKFEITDDVSEAIVQGYYRDAILALASKFGYLQSPDAHEVLSLLQ